ESPDLSGSGFSVWFSARILLPCWDAMVESSVAGAQPAMDVGIERRSRNAGELHRHPHLDGLEHRVLRIDGRGMLSARRTRDAGEGNLAVGSAGELGCASGQGSRRRRWRRILPIRSLNLRALTDCVRVVGHPGKGKGDVLMRPSWILS